MADYVRGAPEAGAPPGGRHLVLLGLPGAGKSTVGPILAARLGREYLDLDAEIQRRNGATIAAIFAEHGEFHFRELERQLTAELAGRAEPMVLAPGGGWVTTPECVALLRPNGVLVYLRVRPATALKRLGAAVAERPLLAAAREPLAALEQLLAEREPRYLDADHVVDTEGLDPERIAEHIVQIAGVR